jgi:hypothetical protein
MSLKVCFGNDIHKISKLPLKYKDLTKHLEDLLKDKLPKGYGLQYVDHEGDQVILANEQDYQNMLDEFKGSNAQKSVKINILSMDTFSPPPLQKNISEDFQVVEKEDYVEVITGEVQAQIKGKNGKSMEKDELSEYIKNNLDEIVGRVATKFENKDHEYKKIVQEFIDRYNQLVPTKQTEINNMFNGIPKRMLAMGQKKEEEMPKIDDKKSKYGKKTIENADKLKGIFTDAKLEILLDFCDMNPNMTIAQLADEYAFNVNKK